MSLNFKKLATFLSLENLIRFLIFGILIYLLFNQGVDLYSKQTKKKFLNSYNQEFERVVLWLKDNSHFEDIVLSEWTQGHQIVALANRRVVATSKVYPSEAEETTRRYKDLARFFFADSENEALNIAKKYQANFIFVRKNFDWWTCRYIAKCHSTAGTLIERMLGGGKFNAFSEIYRSNNFVIFKIEENSEKKLFAGFPENYFSGIIDVTPKIKIQWNGGITPIFGAILSHHLVYTYGFLADFFQKLNQSQPIDTFVLLGPDHFNLNKSFITVSNLSWQTPWGEVEPNKDIVKSLVSEAGATIDNEINEREHSLKNLIPFIKYRFPGAQIVSVIFRDQIDEEKIQKFSATLEKFIDSRTIILVSADFSHWLSLEKTYQEDTKSLRVIKNFDLSEIKNIEADAKPAIFLLLSTMKKLGALNVRVLEHANNLDLLREGLIESKEKTVSYLVSYFFLTFSQ